MEIWARYQSPPNPCGYLPDRDWSLEYELVLSLSPEEYLEKMNRGWRRFGRTVFHPQCPSCRACQSLRIPVDRFQANRSQRRAWKRNEGELSLRIGEPEVAKAKLELYDRYHLFQSACKGWPEHSPKDSSSYVESFVNNPFPTEEWCYYLGKKLVGVGYVDVLPGGMSAIYFFYEPTQRDRSLGTYNVLKILENARARAIPFVYLGYFVAECPSVAYKAQFMPNQILTSDGTWRDFRG